MVSNHHDHWSNRPWIYWAVLGGVGVFFASFMTDWGWVTPAWVQAVGTIGAIVVAFWIGHSDRRRDDTDRRLKARSLALALYPEFMELIVKRRTALQYVAGIFRSHIMGRQYVLVEERAALKIPPVLNDSVDRLYLLGDEIGANLQQILAFSSQYNRMVNNTVSNLKRHPASNNFESRFVKTRQALTKQLDAIGDLLDETEEGLGKIHDG